MEHRLIKALKKQAEADKEEALLTLEILIDSPAGIGEHTSGHFLEEAKKAINKLGEAEDQLWTLIKYLGLLTQEEEMKVAKPLSFSILLMKITLDILLKCFKN